MLRPGEGGVLQLGPTRPAVKVSAAIGSRRPCLIESWLPPGGGFIFPHWREDLEEALYVLDGQINYPTGR